jgi:hypothetical protein
MISPALRGLLSFALRLLNDGRRKKRGHSAFTCEPSDLSQAVNVSAPLGRALPVPHESFCHIPCVVTVPCH